MLCKFIGPASSYLRRIAIVRITVTYLGMRSVISGHPSNLLVVEWILNLINTILLIVTFSGAHLPRTKRDYIIGGLINYVSKAFPLQSFSPPPPPQPSVTMMLFLLRLSSSNGKSTARYFGKSNCYLTEL